MINITKLTNGAVEIEDTVTSQKTKYYTNLVNNQVVLTKADQITVISDRLTLTFDYSEIGTINGSAKPATVAETQELLAESVFNFGGGSGQGAVESVTGNLVNNTDPSNPIVSIPDGTDKKIVGFDSGGKPTAMLINVKQLTDIGGFPSFANGVFTATAMNPATETGFLTFIEFSTTTPKVGTFPTYLTGGVLRVGDAADDNDAVSLQQLNAKNETTVIKRTDATGYNVPEGLSGKLIVILENGATGMPTITLPEFLGTIKGLEITFINFSDDRSIIFKGFGSQAVIHQDVGSGGENEVMITSGSSFVYLCTGEFLISY